MGEPGPGAPGRPTGTPDRSVTVREMLEVLPIPCLVVDGERTITEANDAATRLLGRTTGQLTSLHLDELFPDLRPGLQESPSARGQARDTRLVETSDPTGEGLTLLAHVGPLDDTLGGRLVLLEDASDMSEPERELQRYAEELERSNRDLEQFVYGASHDLKEPLRVIEGHLRLIEQRVRDDLDPGAQASMGYALDGVQRLQDLIQGLLSYSRAGFRNEPFEPVDAQDALDRALANLSVAIDERGAEITHDPLPTVLADPIQLTMVFQNLISNAIKFTPEDRTPRVHIGHDEDDQRPHLYVRDNGIGIDPDVQERLFEMFERLHGPDEYPGSGIGLALCKRIAERHGGDIWVDGEPGQGSTFHLTLGTERDQASHGEPDRDDQAHVETRSNGHSDTYSVILVDDVEGIRALVRLALEAKDRFEVIGEAGNGQEGIDLARETQPDVVLLDLSMPGMDGLEALPKIKEVAQETKVAIYSGFQGSRLGQTAVDLGAIGYMEKGTDPDELEAELLRLVREHASATT